MITITDLNNAKVDVDHIAAIANSLSPTATDRLGNVKQTISGITAAGKLALNVKGITIPAGGTTAGSSTFKLTTQSAPLVTPEQGAFELVGNSLQFTQKAKRRGVVMSSSVITSTTTLENTTTESSALITAEHGANYLEVGKAEEVVIRGTIQQTTAGAGVLQVRTKYDGVTLLAATTVSAVIPAGTPFEVRIATTVRTIGTTGTMQINAVLWIDGVANVADAQTLATINTTIAQNLTITAQWTVANTSNTISVHQGRVLSIEPSR